MRKRVTVTAQWDNDKDTVIRYDLAGRWTWAEFLVAADEVIRWMQPLPHTVHFIVNPLDDLSRGYLPPGTMQSVLSIYRKAPPNTGSTVLIGTGSLHRTIYGLAQKIYPQIAARYMFVDTLDEARAVLSHLR